MKNKKTVIATGGTGGHIYPALTLADQLKAKNVDVVFIGNKNNMEATIVPAHGYDFYPIQNKGLTGSVVMKIWRMITQLGPTIVCMRLLRDIKPNRVVVFGGYVSIPVGFAAYLCRIPLVLHEQNAMAGFANRVLSLFASKIAVSYLETVDQFPKRKVVLTGNPRESVFKRYREKDSFLSEIGFKNDLPLVLIVMGSLGSETINEQLKAFVPMMNEGRFQVIITTGQQHYEDFSKNLQLNPFVHITGQVNQIEVLSYTDLIVCRGGATTVSEIIAAQIPAIFVPSPFVVKNHQYLNVKPLIDKNAGLLLLESDFSASTLYNKIVETLDNDELLQTISSNLKTLAKGNAIDDLIDLIENIE
jgi:UDP-N-acetylglucosamine--N-acetylmuramyl-(pentapeptide) pyrophosphoryl-undecaprenol N-acetylglucosamine transferase